MDTDRQIPKLREKLMLLLIIFMFKIDLIRPISIEKVIKISISLKSKETESGFTETEQYEFIKKINKKRHFVDPTAAGMTELVWNHELSMLAKNWSDECTQERELKRCGKLISLKDYSNSRNYNSYDYHDPLFEWTIEDLYYNYIKNTCDDACNHYKVVMNAKIHSVGCSRSHCKSGEDSFKIIICNFYPISVGDLKERPYVAGPSCSRCPNNETCLPSGNLCGNSDRRIPSEELKCERESLTFTSLAQRSKCSNVASLMIMFFACCWNYFTSMSYIIFYET